MRAFLFGIGLTAPNYYPNLLRYVYPKLGKMTRNEFSHFKHGDLFLAAKNGFQFVIRVDIATIRSILQIMLLDVFPDFLCYFSAWHWRCADNCC